MAKKAKAVEEVKAKPEAVKAPQSVTVVDDFDALLSGVKSEAKPEAKSSVPEVVIIDKDVKKSLKKYVRLAALEKSAEGRKKAAAEDVKKAAKPLYIALCRSQNIYHRTICLDKDANFGSIQLDVASPSQKNGTTVESIRKGLETEFGAEDFKKYFNRQRVLSMQDTSIANIKKLMFAFGMTTDAGQKAPKPAVNAKPEDIALYEAGIMALGKPQFDAMFKVSDVLLLTEVGGDKEKTVLLKKDGVMLPAVSVKIEDCIKKHLLTENMGTLTAQPDALAMANDIILKEEEEKEKILAEAEEKLAKAS